MTDALKFALHEPVQAHNAFDTAWKRAKALLMAGHRLTLTLKPETRNDAQNALLHALLTEIAATREWAGRKRDVEIWKRLLVAAWLRARGESVEILPALDGHGIDVVFRRTSTLSKGECAELIDFIEAWRAGA
jgi:hypothetical protein